MFWTELPSMLLRTPAGANSVCIDGPAARNQNPVMLPLASSEARSRAICAGRYQPWPISSSRFQNSLTGRPSAFAATSAAWMPSSPSLRP
jgi:hypothetical protein